MSVLCGEDTASHQNLLLSSSSSVVESCSEYEPSVILGGHSDEKQQSDNSEVLDDNIAVIDNEVQKNNVAFVKDSEDEKVPTHFNLLQIENTDMIENIKIGGGLNPGPCSVNSTSDITVPQPDYRLNFSPVESLLLSVPEHDLLPHVEHLASLAQSKDSDGTSETQDTYSESNSTAVSYRSTGCSQLTKAEPLTAKQQVALWLTRTSAQDIQDLKMSSLKNLINPSSSSSKYKMPGQPSPVLVGCKSTKMKDIRRNPSTKSLMERSSCSSKDEHGAGHTQIKKSKTVLALAQDKSHRDENDKAKSCSAHGSQHAMFRCKKAAEISSKPSLKSSRISLFKRRFSKCGSEIIPATLYSQATAPGELCRSQAGADSPHPFPGLRPTNRLRSTSSVLQCSRCTSVLSMTTSRIHSRATSQMSLMLDRKYSKVPTQEDVQCKICLYDCPVSAMVRLDDCGCAFCRDCMQQYITFEIMEGAYEISCPDPVCPIQGVLNQQQMESLTDKELVEKHRTFRLNTEVSLDAARTWCPSVGCDTICHICAGTKSQGVPVSCPTCVKEFCSLCSATWHPGMSCSENGALLVKQGGEAPDPFAWDLSDENIKRCPMCSVPIERDAGCAQMMCKRCKHVFCWYCLTSLDDDFLLRHYDSGECQGKLGHSRASVICHRAQVIGIFAGFGILLLVASPLLLVAAPCIICCKCRACSKTDENAVKRVGSEFVAARR